MKIFYIQPIIAKYRLPLLNSLCLNYNVTILASNENSNSLGFDENIKFSAKSINTPINSYWKNKFFFQFGIIKAFLSERPDIVISFANPRFISYWISLVFCKVNGIRFYSHGQGLYSYPTPGKVRTLIYKLMVSLSTRYICYTELSRISMLAIGCPSSRLEVAENSILLSTIVNSDEKTYCEKGVLFIGRLREDCRLEILVESIRILRNKKIDIILHVIGNGILANHYREKFSNDEWIFWHGAIHDDKKIAEISLDCRLGCYPGDAGLSVVHMFGLSLPQLIHGSISEHMGPEPSYIIDKNNGFLFDKISSLEYFTNKLKNVWEIDPAKLKIIGRNAYKKYLNLNDPELGDRFLKIIAKDELKKIQPNINK